MPFIDGEALRDKLNRETQLTIEDVVRIATEAAEAWIGIALAMSAAAGGMSLGTPHYMSPEQAPRISRVATSLG